MVCMLYLYGFASNLWKHICRDKILISCVYHKNIKLNDKLVEFEAQIL